MGVSLAIVVWLFWSLLYHWHLTLSFQNRFVAFFVFILFSSFFIVNLVVAVICESLLQVSRGPQQEAQSTMSLKVEKDDKLLQDMMQQILKNQSVMAASLRGLQQDVQMLKEQNEEKPVEYMQQLPDELPSTE